MARVVRVGAPVDAHLGVDVPLVEGQERRTGCLDVGTTRLGELRILLLVKLEQGLRYALLGLLARLVTGAQDLQSLPLDPRQRRIDVTPRERPVQGAAGDLEAVRRPGVAVEAVHRAGLQARCLCGVPIGPGELRDLPLRRRITHPRDALPGRVGEELDRHARIHVEAVDAAARRPSAHVQREHGHRAGVGLVEREPVQHVQAPSVEALRPVAGLADLPGRPQLVHRRGDGTAIAVEQLAEHLPHTTQLGLYVGAPPRADVALHALHVAVRRVLVGSVLGRHAVARRPTEARRVHVLDRGVAEVAAHEHVEAGGHEHEDRDISHLAVLPPQSAELPSVGPAALLAAVAQPHAEGDQHEAADEGHRQGDDEEQTEVWVLCAFAYVHRQHEQPQDRRGVDQKEPHVAPRVVSEVHDPREAVPGDRGDHRLPLPFSTFIAVVLIPQKA